MKCARHAALLLIVLQLASAVNIVYDEAKWTKAEWRKYKVDFDPLESFNPSEEGAYPPALQTALSHSTFNSLDGPFERRRVTRTPGLWHREGDGTGHTFDDQSAVDHAAQAVQCTACHALLQAAWKTSLPAIHAHEMFNQGTARDALDAACEDQVVDSVLTKYTLFDVPADPDGGGLAPALAGILGGQLSSSRLFVVRERKRDGPPRTPAEEAAVAQACQELVANHGEALAKLVVQQAKHYYQSYLETYWKFRELVKVGALPSEGAGGDDDDPYEDPKDEEEEEDGREAGRKLREAEGQPAQDAKDGSGAGGPPDIDCVDLHVLCPFWAHIGECESNPAYMVGLGPNKKGHCMPACGRCTPDDSWRSHATARAELDLAAGNTLHTLRQLGCAEARACLTGASGTSSGTGMIEVSELDQPTPGQLLAGVPGFVLGKPFWAIPTVAPAEEARRTDPRSGAGAGQATRHPSADAVGADAASGGAGGGGGGSGRDPGKEAEAEAEAALAVDLSGKVLSIPGMDDGFFQYDYLHRQELYHFHEQDDGTVSEYYLLGQYDAAATAATTAARVAAQASAPGPPQGAARLWGERASKAEAAAAAAAADAASPNGDSAAATGGGEKADGGAAAAADRALVTALSAPPFLEGLDLLPDVRMQDRHWPYVAHNFTGGDECVLGGGVRRMRSAVVRLTCSPDTDPHMLVREPEFCSYVVVVYSPALCALPAYRPLPKARGGGGGGGGGGGAALASARDALLIAALKQLPALKELPAMQELLQRLNQAADDASGAAVVQPGAGGGGGTDAGTVEAAQQQQRDERKAVGPARAA